MVELLSEQLLDAADAQAAAGDDTRWWTPEGRPAECAWLQPPLLLRQVLLRRPPGGAQTARAGPVQPPLVYAASWWNEGAYEEAMGCALGAPIWSNLAAKRTEAFRELCMLRLTPLPAHVSSLFGCGAGERVWARHYVLHSGGKPLCVVFEAFNAAALSEFVGSDDARAAFSAEVTAPT